VKTADGDAGSLRSTARASNLSAAPPASPTISTCFTYPTADFKIRCSTHLVHGLERTSSLADRADALIDFWRCDHEHPHQWGRGMTT
jgi:hypothetical protein